MSKRTLYTVVTPLPATITRATAIAALHNHAEMIQLNPLVINHERSTPAANAPPDEFHAIWYTLTDRISYLPGVKGKVSYKACFHDLPNGLQTHVYAPAGLEIKEKWSIGGNEPGEEREVFELGLFGVPRDGLYLREDVDMSCSIFLTSFVKKNLRKAHSVLVERLVVKADLEEDRRVRSGYSSRLPSLSHSSFAPSLRSRSSMASSSGGLAPINTKKRLSAAEFLAADNSGRFGPQPTSPTHSSRNGSIHSGSQQILARPAGSVPNFSSPINRHPSQHMGYQPYQLPDSNMLGPHHPSTKPYPPPTYAPPPTPFDPSIRAQHAAYRPVPMSKSFSAATTDTTSSTSSHPVMIAELAADDTHIPPYARQQTWHEEQIWHYLDNHHLSGAHMPPGAAAEMDVPSSPDTTGGATTPPSGQAEDHARSRAHSVAYSMSVYDETNDAPGARSWASTPSMGQGDIPPVPVRALGRPALALRTVELA